MIVLALDMATACGWAVGNPMTTVKYGVKNLAPNGKTVSPGKRFQRLRNLMVDKMREHKDLKLIAFELPISASTSSIQKAYAHGYVAIIQHFCADYSLGYRGVYVSTLKKFLTGNGRAEKADMIAAINARGFFTQDDNEADAIAILLWATQISEHSADLAG